MNDTNQFVYDFSRKNNIDINILFKLFTKIKDIFKIDNYDDILEEQLKTSEEEQYSNDEVSTPYVLIKEILNNTNDNYFLSNPKILDYCCGKGAIIYNTFIHYYNILINVINDPFTCVKNIIEEKLYIGDINNLNVFITLCLIYHKAIELSNKEYNYSFNYYIGDAFKLKLYNIWKINSIQGVFVNPPFHDENNQGSTQHKIWIDLTLKTFDDWLDKDGLLLQISPESFSSPSSKILNLMKEKNVLQIHFNQRHHFPNIGSTISWYLIENKQSNNMCLINGNYKLNLSELVYIPQDPCGESISIHEKVMFVNNGKIDMKYDYVNCHNNILLKAKRNKTHSTLSKIKTTTHLNPVFHTNKQIWYSEIKQDILNKKKVLFSRSGYTKFIYDKGEYGVTDLGYYVLVNSDEEGNNLVHNLSSKLFNYILKSAKWSGFGNEKVFELLPNFRGKKFTDQELYSHFKLTEEEITYLESKV